MKNLLLIALVAAFSMAYAQGPRHHGHHAGKHHAPHGHHVGKPQAAHGHHHAGKPGHGHHQPVGRPGKPGHGHQQPVGRPGKPGHGHQQPVGRPGKPGHGHQPPAVRPGRPISPPTHIKGKQPVIREGQSITATREDVSRGPSVRER